MHQRACVGVISAFAILAGGTSLDAQEARSGDQVYQAACAACHAADGRGAPQTVVGFDIPLPDFTDCSFATREPDADWFAIAHDGGPVRAFDRMMPAFGRALDADDITRSIEHIRATPGFPWEGWPTPMPLGENLRDLEQHAADFAALAGFTYTVRSSADGEVLGCVYIYPDPTGEHDALVRSWVRASHAKLDAELWRVVTGWLADAWPFTRVSYAARGDG